MIKLIFVLTSCTLLFLYSLTLCHTILDNCSFLSGFFSKLGLKNYLESIFFLFDVSEIYYVYSMSIKSTISTLCLSNLLCLLYLYHIYLSTHVNQIYFVYSMSIKSAISTRCPSNLLFISKNIQGLRFVYQIYHVYSRSIKSTSVQGLCLLEHFPVLY